MAYQIGAPARSTNPTPRPRLTSAAPPAARALEPTEARRLDAALGDAGGVAADVAALVPADVPAELCAFAADAGVLAADTGVLAADLASTHAAMVAEVRDVRGGVGRRVLRGGDGLLRRALDRRRDVARRRAPRPRTGRGRDELSQDTTIARLNMKNRSFRRRHASAVRQGSSATDEPLAIAGQNRAIARAPPPAMSGCATNVSIAETLREILERRRCAVWSVARRRPLAVLGRGGLGSMLGRQGETLARRRLLDRLPRPRLLRRAAGSDRRRAAKRKRGRVVGAASAARPPPTQGRDPPPRDRDVDPRARERRRRGHRRSRSPGRAADLAHLVERERSDGRRGVARGGRRALRRPRRAGR